ncbi:hypothetical protein BDA96_07G005200 [Sorghum bicolor]|jgi:hypothetical protein|uniref:Uncharacterized protein n=2 Tax=Sorghum bicolor TaxID=4558 RepID=A0A921U900_SORBI|nr:uncharacterized protein LOC8064337 [Sorghum bicolor]KAG0522070.1 hypothetical protein BDA96_07G005200 [Sorghum bicolor]KXG24179.1 hypothetical protein SORBI_3007G004900 [Sorghum bicolor]|eukprot:XP_021320188.1 uncharacterized protein LOC8064337 [Sorghum bicolor]
MAHSKREIKPGRAHTKVAGDDEMLRTGFYDGTPLEGGKIADSKPVDLFAAARRVADQAVDPDSQQQQQQQEADDEGTTNKNKNVIADNPAATATEQPGRRQGVAEPPTGGRRLGVGRPA